MQHKGLYRVSHRYILSVLFVWAGMAVAYAQDSKLTGARLGSPDHLVLTTSADKVSFQSVLSGDKRKVIITVKNAVVGFDQREVNSAKGLMQTAFIRQQGKDAVIIADLRDTAGFTAVSLPYSQSIAVDFFKWNTLTTSETAYRSGLLAWQNGAYDIAGSYFREAERSGHPDGTAFLGFLYTMAGKSAEGATFLQRALARNTSYSDIYGALAEIERSKNDEIKAREYENEFVKKLGRLPTYAHELITLSERAVGDDEPLSLSAIDEATTLLDTAVLTTGATTEDARIESVTRQLRSMQGTDESMSAASDAKRNTQLPAWFLPTLSGLAIAVVLISFVLLRGYMRWRKQQMLINAAVAADASFTAPGIPAAAAMPPSFDSDLHAALAVQENVATARYKAQELDIERTPEGTTVEPSMGYRDDVESVEARMPVVDDAPKDQAEELFDFSEAFYAARERTSERRRSELSQRNFTPPLDNPIFTSDAPAQVSGSDTREFAEPDIRDRSNVAGSRPVQPTFESGKAIEADPRHSRMLDVDEESIANLARQIGIDPAIIDAQRRGRKQAPASSGASEAFPS